MEIPLEPPGRIKGGEMHYETIMRAAFAALMLFLVPCLRSSAEPTNDDKRDAVLSRRAILYDEDANDPQGKRYVGTVVWRIETLPQEPGSAPELVMRADVEIPEARFRMTWRLRHNTDKSLPASHTIELMFTVPTDFPEGGIAEVPGVLSTETEGARGIPLESIAVQVTGRYFMIGLSGRRHGVQRNIELLRKPGWFDIPIVYTSGKRAILSVEKQ